MTLDQKAIIKQIDDVLCAAISDDSSDDSEAASVRSRTQKVKSFRT